MTTGDPSRLGGVMLVLATALVVLALAAGGVGPAFAAVTILALFTGVIVGVAHGGER